MEQKRDMDINSIVSKAIKGDKEAFGILYTEYYNDVYYVCMNLIGNENTSKDIAQDVFVKSFEKISELNNPMAFKKWIVTTATRMSLNYLKREKIIEFTSIDNEAEITELPYNNGEKPDDIVIDKNTADILMSAINKLPAEQRICVFMYYYENYSVKEIKELIGCSENTIRGRLRYAINNLRNQIENMNDEGIKLKCLSFLPFLFLIFETERKLLPESHSIKTFKVSKKLRNPVARTAMISAGVLALAGAVAIGISTLFGGKTKKTNENITDKTEDAAFENNKIKDISAVEVSDSFSKLRIEGNIYYVYNDNNEVISINRISDNKEIIKFDIPSKIYIERKCDEYIINIFGDDDKITVIGYNGELLYQDDVVSYKNAFCFDYSNILNYENNLVYITNDGTSDNLKCVNIETGELLYTTKLGNKCGNDYTQEGASNYFFIIGNKEGRKIINLGDGNVILDNIKDEAEEGIILSKDKIIKTTNYSANSYVKKYEQFDAKGNLLFSKEFEKEERYEFNHYHGMPCMGYGCDTFLCIRGIEGEKFEREMAIVESDLTEITDYGSLDVSEAEYIISTANSAKLMLIHNYGKGYIVMNGSDKVVETTDISGEDMADLTGTIEVDSIDGKKYLIVLYTGAAIEIDEKWCDGFNTNVKNIEYKKYDSINNAHLYMLYKEDTTNNGRFATSEFEIYDANGNKIIAAQGNISNTAGVNNTGTMLSYFDSTTKKGHLYNIKTQKDIEIDIDEEILETYPVRDSYFMYKSIENDEYVYKLINVDTKEIKELTRGDNYSLCVSDYGYILYKQSEEYKLFVYNN